MRKTTHKHHKQKPRHKIAHVVKRIKEINKNTHNGIYAKIAAVLAGLGITGFIINKIRR